jgi:hypothetical protein
MKLLFCPTCCDVKKLDRGNMQHCSCKRSCGRYLDDGLHAEVGGIGKVICVANSDIREAVDRPDHPTLRCWMINESPHLKRIK